MKKIVMLMMLAVMMVGCSSIQYNNAREGVRLGSNELIKMYPMQAELEVGEKIRGVAECEKWFGFFYSKPQKQTYGTMLQNESGNIAARECTRGAIYDAISKSGADTIVAPKYTTIQKRDLCILGIKSLCLHVVDQVMVSGYKGTVKNIKPMDKELVDFKWKNEALNK